MQNVNSQVETHSLPVARQPAEHNSMGHCQHGRKGPGMAGLVLPIFKLEYGGLGVAYL
jgi:hypothetical protein